ncbi:hypothetical protein [Rhizobium leguminosarum]|uniref:Uncharacterized protein n=1 Tax=Rhizobium leguminosarum TaxID=384 RepID=A0A2K9ZG95_RHILE|nr:hypothetical protein [Rhizobium leguminosarum]AUW47276.1 hypothetical protein CUJ84_pRLN3000140 [Rhizobium leguminosarum]
MTRILTIVHIEDEYREFLDIVLFVKTVLEDLWEDKSGEIISVTNKILAESKSVPQSWVVYELSQTPVERQTLSGDTIRYMFVRDKSVPPEALAFLSSDGIFILDVLRPVEGKTSLGISVTDSLEAISPYITSDDRVVLFTAHQGNGLDDSVGSRFRKISKENRGELEEFLSLAVHRSMADG